MFGNPRLTDAVLQDLLTDEPTIPARIVVIDNGGDYEFPDPRVEIHRPGHNLRWIGAANWALESALRTGTEICVVLNNDIRLSPAFLAGLAAAFEPEVAVVAACYDDFWLHQRASVIPSEAAAHVARPVDREVPFCDGTAIAFATAAVAEVGLLDTVAFPRHGYGSDLDFALRARAAGYRCVVTERAYVSHLRRQTMNLVGQTSEQNRAEILSGMDAKWGGAWRRRLSLSSGAFPAHNTGSAESWYLAAPGDERAS